jgi:membrane glycosyltransferase
VRRLILLGFVLGQTYVAVYLMTAVLPYHGSHWLEMCILVLYAILFAWVGSGFWTALMGFWVLLWGKRQILDQRLDRGRRGDRRRNATAILVPIFNEDVARVFAGIRATYDSIARTGKLKHFEFFVLSDTIDSDTRVAELQAWLTMCREVNGFDHIHYRRRTHRIRRKSGNVADWCRRWGSAFNYMVVLDADSVMSGDCLVRLTQLMEANPSAGIIQTAPWAAGRETMYARIQQFSTRVYGPLFTAGLHFWQLGESHYWGHNAILRVAPFMRHCALSKLPGTGSMSGEILSHDFVEAALMRRAGWSVWIAYDLPGSWEEMPPTLLDELKRDRRWCQGNLMNFRLFLSRVCIPAHRAVFMTGVMAYLSAPLWFLFLVLSTALLAVNVLSEPVYFTQSYQLFPNWPEWHPEWAARLFGATATLLWLPKLLSAILIIAKPSMWRGFGGPIRLFFSVFFESIFSAALAPIRMLFHAKFVTLGLLGVAISWKSPPRDDAETHWADAFTQHWGGTVLGTDLGRRRVLAAAGVPVLAAAGRGLADIGDSAVGAVVACASGPRIARSADVPDPGRIDAAARAALDATGAASWSPPAGRLRRRGDRSGAQRVARSRQHSSPASFGFRDRSGAKSWSIPRCVKARTSSASVSATRCCPIRCRCPGASARLVVGTVMHWSLPLP